MTEKNSKNLDEQIEDFQTKTELKQLRFDLKTQRQMNKFLTEKIDELKKNSNKNSSNVDVSYRLTKLNFGNSFTFDKTNREFNESYNELREIINNYVSQNKQKNSSK